jgi:peptide deformylase
MALRKILTYPDPRLKEECRPVEAVDKEVKRLIADLAETMYSAPGSGLAAPQVGVPLRVIVCDPAPKDQPRRLIALVNPEIVAEDGFASIEEGCLSCPEIEVPVPRSAWVRVEGLDAQGRPVGLEADGFLAIVLQHEIDHLAGNLIVDHLSALKRKMYRHRLKKAAEEEK